MTLDRTHDKGVPYRRHKPSAALRDFLDPLDPGSYFDCGRARLRGLDDALLEEARSRGRQVGDDSFQLVATDMGVIYCRPSISFAIAARWDEVTIERPEGGDPVVLRIDWPTHGRLKFTVSQRLAGNIHRRWTQLQVQTDRRIDPVVPPTGRSAVETIQAEPTPAKPSDVTTKASTGTTAEIASEPTAAATVAGPAPVDPPSTAETDDTTAARPVAVRGDGASTADDVPPPSPHPPVTGSDPDPVPGGQGLVSRSPMPAPDDDDPRQDPVETWEVVSSVDRAALAAAATAERKTKQDRRHKADILRPARREEPPPRRRAAVRRVVSSQNAPGAGALPHRSRAVRRPVPRFPGQDDDDRPVGSPGGDSTPAAGRPSTPWPGRGAADTPSSDRSAGRPEGADHERSVRPATASAAVTTGTASSSPAVAPVPVGQPDRSLAVSTAASSPVGIDQDLAPSPAERGQETTVVTAEGGAATGAGPGGGTIARIDIAARPGIAARIDAAELAAPPISSPRTRPGGGVPTAPAAPAATDTTATVAARARFEVSPTAGQEPAGASVSVAGWHGQQVEPIPVDLTTTMPPSWIGGPASLVGALVAVSTLVLLVVLAVSTLDGGFGLGTDPAPAGPNVAVIDHQRFRPDVQDAVDDTPGAGEETSSPAVPASSAVTASTVTTGSGAAPVAARPGFSAAEGQGCNSNYSGCVPDAETVECPALTGEPIAWSESAVVMGSDVYGLDTDGDGEICEPDQPGG
ncbi:MAG: hypothetical protein AAF547_05975 [Actinomycetota bacterium]